MQSGLIELDARGLKSKVIDVGPPAHGHQNRIGGYLDRTSRFVEDHDLLASFLLDACQFRAEMECDTVALELLSNDVAGWPARA